MRKYQLNKIKKIVLLLFLGISFIVIGLLLRLLSNKYKLVIFVFNLLTGDIMMILYLLTMICFGIALFMIVKCLCNRYPKLRLLFKGIFAIATIIVAGISLVMFILFAPSETHRLVLKSPDKEHTIVITESSFLLYGGGNFYEKVNPLFIERIGGFSADDGYRPFTNGEYTVEWFEDGLNIRYLFNSPDIYHEERLYYLDEKINGIFSP